MILILTISTPPRIWDPSHWPTPHPNSTTSEQRGIQGISDSVPALRPGEGTAQGQDLALVFLWFYKYCFGPSS